MMMVMTVLMVVVRMISAMTAICLNIDTALPSRRLFVPIT